MLALELTSVVKRFGDLVAVDGLTLAVKSGELFPFSAPRGAESPQRCA